MDYSELAKKKTAVRDELKKLYNLPKRSKSLVVVYFPDSSYWEEILQGLVYLGANFLFVSDRKIEIPKTLKNVALAESLEWISWKGIDALVTNAEDIEIQKYMELWVVPIVQSPHYLGNILQEFSPMQAQGNAFLFDNASVWSVYLALVRYSENLKFPYDNRILVKNVLWL